MRRESVEKEMDRMTHSLHPKCLACRNCTMCMLDTLGKNSLEAKLIKKEKQNCINVVNMCDDKKIIQIKYLWDSDKLEKVCRSSLQAEQRLKSLEVKLQKMTRNNANPIQGELEEIINQGLKKGFWDIVPKEELERTRKETVYLPYNYASKRDETSTTKSRLVHDPAACIPGTTSLNESMLVLPDTENKLLDVLLRIRLMPILSLCDISKFYFRLHTSQEDRPKFRWLCRRTPDGNLTLGGKGKLVTLEFKGASMMGTKQIPWLAKLARDVVTDTLAEQDTEAGRLAKCLSYFDDLGQGITWMEAKDLSMEDCQRILATRAAKTEAAFNDHSLPVKPWESHLSPHFDSTVKKELYPDQEYQPQDTVESSLLGLSYHLGTDTLGLNKKALNIGRKSRGDRNPDDKITDETQIKTWLEGAKIRKRDLLGISRALYDPLGLAPAITTSLKQKYSEYVEKYPEHTWNTIVSNEVVKNFSPCLQSILLAKKEIRVPRYIGKPLTNNPVSSTLLIVNDGKLHKSGCTMAVLHHEWQVEGRTQVKTHLVASKNKLLPKRIVDQLRGEIASLAIGYKLTTQILSVMKEFKEYNSLTKRLILDSKTTCLLLAQEPTKFQPGVSSVINYTQSLFNMEEIHYLPGTFMDRLADIGTHEWGRAEQSWRLNKYLKGSVFDSPMASWPLTPLTEFLSMKIQNLPFLSKNRITAKDPLKGITTSLRIVTSLAKPKPGPFWDHLRAYGNLQKTVTALMNIKIMAEKWRSKKANDNGHTYRPTPLVEIRQQALHQLLLQEQEWSKLAVDTKPPSKNDYQVTEIKGILCVVGRGLDELPSQRDQIFPAGLKHPVAETGFVAPILHWDSPFTKALISYHHRHGKAAAYERDRISLSWYIPKALQLCEKLRSFCPGCRFITPSSLQAQLGKLPAFRLNPNNNKTLIMDVIGPFTVTERPITKETRNMKKIKVWELIASDSQTRMLYSASMESQSEVSYTEALNSIFTETGYPTMVITDPGSQLVSFKQKAQEGWAKGINSDTIQEEECQDAINNDILDRMAHKMAKLDIQFITNTPKAPWRSGAIESLVAQIKALIREKLMANFSRTMTLISHQNMLKNIISTINDRPLVLYPEDTQIRDRVFITPNSLQGRGMIPPLITPTEGQKSKKPAEVAKEMHARMSNFKQAFSASYVKNLLKYKGMKPDLREMPKKGDVCFILDRAHSDGRHGYQVGLVDKVEGLAVHLIYLPGPKASRPKMMVRPVQGVDVLVRATDAQSSLDFYNYEIDSPTGSDDLT